MFGLNENNKKKLSYLSILEVLNEGKPENQVCKIPLKKVELQGSVIGPIADCCLKCYFEDIDNYMDKVVEAAYHFRITGDVTITAVTAHIGDTQIRAQLTERLQAEELYALAKAKGAKASLLINNKMDTFTLYMANLPTGHELMIEVFYIELAKQDDAGFCLHIPAVETQADSYIHNERDKDYSFELDMVFNGAESVECSAYSAVITNRMGQQQVRLTVMDSVTADCVLYWQPARREQEPKLQVFAHAANDCDEAYFLAMVNPPAKRLDRVLPPQEILILIDRSQTLAEGSRREISVALAARLLVNLRAQDSFNVSLITDELCWFSEKSTKISVNSLQNSLHFIERPTITYGRMDLDIALKQALEFRRVKNSSKMNITRYIVLISDCIETERLAELIRQTRREALKNDRQRINVVFVGSKPSLPIANELGEAGGGMVYYLSDNVNDGVLDSVIDSIIRGWEEPVINGLELKIDRSGVQSAGRQMLHTGDVGWSAIDLGDLSAGHSLWVLGRLRPGGAGVNFCLADSDGNEYQRNAVTLCNESVATNRGIATLFSFRRLTALEYLRQGNYSEKELEFELSRLGYEIESVASKQSIIPVLIRQEALRGGLLCSETAFVAYRYEQGQPPELIPLRLGTNTVCADSSPDLEGINHLASEIVVSKLSAVNNLPESRPGITFFKDVIKPMNFLTVDLTEQGAEPRTVTDNRNYYIVFSGIPHFVNNKAVLFDSSQLEADDRLLSPAVISGLTIDLSPAVRYEQISKTYLYIYLNDLSIPRVKVRLSDIMRHGGIRPLYIAKQPENVIQVVLHCMEDPSGLEDVKVKLVFKLAL